MDLKYNFYYWGPFLYRVKISNKEKNKILTFCKKNKKFDYRLNLAGHIKQEYKLENKKIFPILFPYINSYVLARQKEMSIFFEGDIKIDQVWVNYMKQGEFNPPHFHTADISCVLYLSIPKDIDDKNHVAQSPKPGSISFIYGENLKNNTFTNSFFPEEGDLYIFPSWLHHYVFPFKSKKERVSLSANFYEIKKIVHL